MIFSAALQVCAYLCFALSVCCLTPHKQKHIFNECKWFQKMAKGHFVDPVMQISLHSSFTNKTHIYSSLKWKSIWWREANSTQQIHINDYFFCWLVKKTRLTYPLSSLSVMWQYLKVKLQLPFNNAKFEKRFFFSLFSAHYGYVPMREMTVRMYVFKFQSSPLKRSTFDKWQKLIAFRMLPCEDEPHFFIFYCYADALKASYMCNHRGLMLTPTLIIILRRDHHESLGKWRWCQAEVKIR